MADSLAPKIRLLQITSLYGDQQFGGDTTHLAGVIAENSTLKTWI
jgi:hypothetical protein